MAMRIDGTTIRTPQLKVSSFLISKAERAADGTMNMEIIAEKRRLDLSWAAIRDVDLQQILDLLAGRAFHTVTYPDPELGENTITVYRGDSGQEVGQQVSGTRYWRDVNIALIER